MLGICVKLLVPDHVLFDESNDAGLVGAVVCVVPSLNLIPALNVFTCDQVFVAESCPTKLAWYGTVCEPPVKVRPNGIDGALLNVLIPAHELAVESCPTFVET